jgi:hypothetical protein
MVVAGCAGSAGELREVKEQLSKEMSCPTVQVQREGEEQYFAAGCGSELEFKCSEFFGWHCNAQLSEAEVRKYGSHNFTSSKKEVTEAAASAVKALGYEIAAVDASRGLVVTNRKIIQAVGNGYNAATFQYQQLTVKVKGEGDGSTATVVPAYFVGEKDMSEKGFNISELRKTWSDVFKKISMFL